MKLAVILGGLSGINILLSFVYQWYIVTTLGPGSETDALFAGMVIPQLVLAVVSGSLTHVLVPVLASNTKEALYRDTWSFFLAIGAFSSVLSLLLFLTAPFWAPWTVPGFDSNNKLLTISLVQIQLFGIVFNSLLAVLLSFYHARQKFIWVEVSSLLSTVVGLIFLIWGLPVFGVKIAAWSMLLKGVLQIALLIPGLGGFRKPDWKSIGVVEAWKRLRPLLLGTVYYKTDQLVDRFFVSMTPAGGLSLFHLAQQIYSAGNQIFNKALAFPMVPLLAQAASGDNWILFQKILQKRLLWTAGITSISYILLLLAGQSVLSILFGHNRFESSEVIMLWWILNALIGVWIGGAFGQILSSSFYAKGNTTVPTRIGIIGFSLGIGFKIIGFYLWGVLGMAAGTSVYYFLNVVLLYYALSKRLMKRVQNETLESRG